MTERKLLYRFISLGYCTQISILAKLDLLDKQEGTHVEMVQKAWRKAKESGLLPQLAQQMGETFDEQRTT
jgi:hypothetical protein